ncbi:MAG TPA: HIT family protein [Rhizobiales bacterium]|nr:HIT family protein [Hyphomicrobiales bacterium]
MSQSDKTYDDQNVFAKILRGELPCHKIYEDEHTLAFMDVMPRCDGHCLVVPKAPSRNLLNIEPDDLATLMTSVQIVMRAVKKAFAADGITIQQFNEAAAGQEVFHTHVHILPRFNGVRLDHHTSEMADNDQLAEHAKMIIAALQS